jgi:hypothetical protein
MFPGVDTVGQSPMPGPHVGGRYPRGTVVLVVFVAVVVLALERRHTFRCFTAVQVKLPAAVVRTLPTFLQVVPAIDGAATADGCSCCAGVATGRIPVSAAAPTLIV